MQFNEQGNVVNGLKRFLLGSVVSWAVLFLISFGHLLLLLGQLNKNFRAWLTSQDLLFSALYSMFFNAWVYILTLLVLINLIRIWFEHDSLGRKKAKKWIKPWASLKLAVPVMILLGIFTAAGTIVESRYDLEGAQKMVYHTWWMYSTLALLCICLLAVIVDRLPWKSHHAAFIFAHIGIILLLLGSLETRMKGVDGSMRFEIGESNRFVTLPETDIAVFSSFDGSQYTQIFRQEMDIYKNNFKKKPMEIHVEDGILRVTDSVRYAIPSESIQSSEPGKGNPAVRFQVNNDQVNVNEWLMSSVDKGDVTFDFGPAQLHLVSELPEAALAEANEIYLATGSDKTLQRS